MVWSRRRWEISHRRQHQEFMTAFKYSDEGTWKVALVLRKHGIIHEFTTTQATSITQKMSRTSAHSSFRLTAVAVDDDGPQAKPSSFSLQPETRSCSSLTWHQMRIPKLCCDSTVVVSSLTHHHLLFGSERVDDSKQEKPQDRRNYFKIPTFNNNNN